MTGNDLAKQAVKRQSTLKIIVTSGYDAPAPGSATAIPGAAYLRKPYDDQALEAAVASVRVSP